MTPEETENQLHEIRTLITRLNDRVDKVREAKTKFQLVHGVRVGPNDRLLVTVPPDADQGALEMIQEALTEMLDDPNGKRFVIIAGASVTVLDSEWNEKEE